MAYRKMSFNINLKEEFDKELTVKIVFMTLRASKGLDEKGTEMKMVDSDSRQSLLPE